MSLNLTFSISDKACVVALCAGLLVGAATSSVYAPPNPEFEDIFKF